MEKTIRKLAAELSSAPPLERMLAAIQLCSFAESGENISSAIEPLFDMSSSDSQEGGVNLASNAIVAAMLNPVSHKAAMKSIAGKVSPVSSPQSPKALNILKLFSMLETAISKAAEVSSLLDRLEGNSPSIESAIYKLQRYADQISDILLIEKILRASKEAYEKYTNPKPPISLELRRLYRTYETRLTHLKKPQALIVQLGSDNERLANLALRLMLHNVSSSDRFPLPSGVLETYLSSMEATGPNSPKLNGRLDKENLLWVRGLCRHRLKLSPTDGEWKKNFRPPFKAPPPKGARFLSKQKLKS